MRALLRVLGGLSLVFLMSCGDQPVDPEIDPSFAKGGIPGPPPAEPGDEGKADLAMCAKRSVVEAINGFDEEIQGPDIGSTGSPCQCGDWPEYCPHGTLTYSTVGAVFEWKFSGAGFVPIDHRYVLVVYRDPWPGRNPVCLEETMANRGGRIRFSGSRDLAEGLTDAKIWIVRSNWVDCEGGGFDHRPNPDGVSRMTNDRDADGVTDATESCAFPFGTPGFPCEDASPAYDWLFENELIQYSPGGGQ